MFPFRTDRLLVRPLATEDLEALTAYRNDRDVARFQQWPLPYTVERAAGMVADPAPEDPVAGEWIQLALVRESGTLVGDLGLFTDASGAIATVGYTLATEQQGNGYATEAVAGLVDRLFETGIHRVEATLDPENVASARLLERLGFRYEGRSRQSSEMRGSWGDDDRYALLAEDRRAWVERPTGPPAEVHLIEIVDDNLHAATRLATHRSQERFVAPVLYSLGNALVPGEDDGAPIVPWFRLIEADGELAGFLMVSLPNAADPDPYLWRMLIDARHQGRGIGRRALGLLAAHLAAAGSQTLYVSWEEGRGGPEPFYVKLGFEPTGEVEDGEIVARVPIDTLLVRTAG